MHLPHTHDHTHTTVTAQLGNRKGGHPGSEVNNKGERRKRSETAGPWGRGIRTPGRTQIHSLGRGEGQADGQGSPRGSGGLPGHCEWTGSGSGVHHHPGHLEVGRDTPQSRWGYSTKGLSLLFCQLGCRDRVSLGSHRLVEEPDGLGSPSLTHCAPSPGKCFVLPRGPSEQRAPGDLGT